MKKDITTIILFILIIGFSGQNISAQDRGRGRQSSRDASSVRSSSRNATKNGLKNDTIQKDSIKIYGWKISPRLGERIPVIRDTSFLDFHQSTLVEGKDVAVGYLGNIGSPAQSKIFFNRPETSRYIFLDAFNYWYKKPEDQIFLNTKIPYSNIFYQTAGGDEDGEERFQSEISSNFGKKLNIGIDFDYLYSRGHYISLYNKQFNYDIYASYIGDKYKMHAFVSNNYFNNSENGGLASNINGQTKEVTHWSTYIKNPDQAKRTDNGFNGDSKNIPVNSTGVWNRLQGRRLYLTNRYDLGHEKETVWINDSTQVNRPKENYVSLASIIFTTNYTDQRRRLRANNNLMDDFFRDNEGKYYDNGPSEEVKYRDNLNDFMSYYSFKNTLAFAMNEGFRKWTKFGLTAFLEYDLRKYSIPNLPLPSNNLPTRQIHKGDNALNIGGVLSKESGKYLRYRLLAEKRLDKGSDFVLDGELTTMLFFKNKQMSVKANVYVKDISPSVFEENFASKYINWNKNLDNIRRIYAGGEINIPFLKAKISGGFETIRNYIYYDYTGVVQQYDKQINIMSLRLDHKFKVGILHWDNQIVFQKNFSEDKNNIVLPLPDYSIYSNLYLQTKIAKVLNLQFGIDTYYHADYYAPGYNYVTMQFTNQNPNDKFKVGKYPMSTAYLNLNLKYTRFFIMYYNAAQSIMNDPNYFSLYKYPTNPAIIKFGLSWKFNN